MILETGMSKEPIRSADGQLIRIPDSVEWNLLLNGNKVLGRCLGSPDLAVKRLALAKKYPNILVGVYGFQDPAANWFLMHAINLSDGSIRRTELETLTCRSCSHKILSANHKFMDLYILSPDPDAAWREALALPEIGCPVCGASLYPRSSIWTAEYFDNPKEA